MPNDSHGADERPLDGLRVLVVDDYADARDLFAFLLTRSGAEVTTVGSAAEAIVALADERFDAVVSDVHMPHESGLELIRRIRCRPDVAGLPAVAVTADRDPSMLAELLEAGFQRCLGKPIGLGDLVAAVLEVVAS